MMVLQKMFIDRTKLVTGYLRSLKDLERRVQAPGRGFYKSASAITASRAASFIMMYNCIEFGVREATHALRKDIRASGVNFIDLVPHWKEEIVVSKFSERLKSGTNFRQVLKDFSIYIPGTVDWDHPLDRVPFAGNIDNVRVIDFVKKLDPKWKPPKSTLGGSDLDLIRRVRNDLAHGKEEFEVIGSSYNTEDLIEKFSRSRTFIISMMRAVEKYSANKNYVIS